MEQLTKIKKQYLVFSLVFTFLVVIGGFFQVTDNTFPSIKAINFSLISEIEFTFGLIFIFLLVIFSVNNIAKPLIKYYIFIILFLSFSIDLWSMISSSHYTFLQNLTNSIIHTGILALISIGIYSLNRRINSAIFLIFGLFSVLLYSIVISYYVGLDQKEAYQINENNKKIYIETGIIVNKLREYNIMSSISRKKDDVNKFNKLKKIKMELIKVDFELMEKSPLLLNILIKSGYCEQWNFLRKNNFLHDLEANLNEIQDFDELVNKLNKECE